MAKPLVLMVGSSTSDISEVAARLLRDEAYELCVADTPETALAQIRERAPDWVLLDGALCASEDGERLLDAQNRYREVLEHLPDIVYVNRNERIIFVNAAGVEQLRASSEAEILGRSPFDFIHPDFHQKVRERIQRARQQPMVSPITENCLVALDGTLIPVEIIASSYRSGEHMDIQVIARDIRARKQAEADRELLVASEQQARRDLEDSQALLHMASDLAQLGAWSIELPSFAVTWSDKVYELHELPVGTPVSAGLGLSFYAPEHQDAIRTAVNDCATQGRPFDLELKIITASGRPIWARIIGHSVRDMQDRIVRVQGAVQDISQRKDAEQRERKLQQQLQQSQRMESVGQLTGGVAHDFNNLLTVILGNAELLSEELGPDSELGAIAGMMSTAAQRGAKLTNSLLAFARRQVLDPAPVDTNELLQGMYQLLFRTLGEDVDIQLALAAGLRPSMVDPAQLESALLNLCLNARDAMPDGGRLTIETTSCECAGADTEIPDGIRSGVYNVVAVSDTGCGIPAEDLPRLFEPFFSTKGPGKGTGLGLPMVYGFMQQSGGQVTVYSEPGEGTTVKLYLPVCAREERARPEAQSSADALCGEEAILLVEDDELVRDYARSLVSSFGYAVTTAASGPEALAILRAGRHFDLLFTDIVMSGGMDGAELARQAQALRPDLKVLFTSGYTQNAIVHRGRLDPGVQLVSKPYRPAELAARLRAVLDQSESV